MLSLPFGIRLKAMRGFRTCLLTDQRLHSFTCIRQRCRPLSRTRSSSRWRRAQRRCFSTCIAFRPINRSFIFLTVSVSLFTFSCSGWLCLMGLAFTYAERKEECHRAGNYRFGKKLSRINKYIRPCFHKCHKVMVNNIGCDLEAFKQSLPDKTNLLPGYQRLYGHVQTLLNSIACIWMALCTPKFS